MEEITVKNIRPPNVKDIDRDLQWLCDSLGIMKERDREKSGFKIFKVILESSKDGKGLKINEITERVELSRTAIVHHLKYMEDSGVIIEKNRSYELRRRSLRKVVDEIEKDVMRSIEEMREIAKEIDENLGIGYRE